MAQRIHILGASGCGVSTLGRAVAEAQRWPYFDTDDFYWLPTDPPFRLKREPEDRLERVLDATLGSECWVLGGALDGWGDRLVARFDLVVFLDAPTEVRLERLRAREAELFGPRIEPGGDMHEHHQRFIAWAASYETGGIGGGRCRQLHEDWLARLRCPVLRLDASRPRPVLVDEVGARL